MKTGMNKARWVFLLFFCSILHGHPAFSGDGDPIRLPEAVKQKILGEKSWSTKYFQVFSQAREGQVVEVMLRLKVPMGESLSEAYRANGVNDRYDGLRQRLKDSSSLTPELEEQLNAALGKARRALRGEFVRRQDAIFERAFNAVRPDFEALKKKHGDRFRYEELRACHLIFVDGPIEAVISLLEKDLIGPGIMDEGRLFYPHSCQEALD